MQITKVETQIVSGGARNLTFVTVETDEGISGVGEAGLTGRELAVEGAVRHLAELLVCEDPSRIEHLWQRMSRGGFLPALGAVAAARSAIDIALWDVNAKALGVPVYRLLGGLARDRVVCYPPCNETTVEGLFESARAAVAEGWKFVRWGLPPQGELLEPRVAIRTAVQQFEALPRSALRAVAQAPTTLATRASPSVPVRRSISMARWSLY